MPTPQSGSTSATYRSAVSSLKRLTDSGKMARRTVGSASSKKSPRSRFVTTRRKRRPTKAASRSNSIRRSPGSGRKGFRRYPTGRLQKRVAIDDVTHHNIAGFLNAFAKTDGATIPDGAAAYSLAENHRVTKPFQVPRDEIMHIILYPGLAHGVFYQTDQYANDAYPSSGGTHIKFNTNFEMTGKMEYVVKPNDPNYPGNSPFNATQTDQFKTTLNINESLSKWRTVSQAMRLLMFNTDDTNDGWFEACRMPYQPRMLDWFLETQNTDTIERNVNDGEEGEKDLGKVDLLLGNPFLDKFVNKNLAEEKSYTTGVLKGIHEFQFNLCHTSANKDFVEMEEAYTLQKNGAVPRNLTEITEEDAVYSADVLQLQEGAVQAKKLMESQFDRSMDMIYIRLHTGAEHNADMLMEVACNQEVIYGPDTRLNKHMKPAQKMSPGLLSSMKNLMQDMNQEAAVSAPISDQTPRSTLSESSKSGSMPPLEISTVAPSSSRSTGSLDMSDSMSRSTGSKAMSEVIDMMFAEMNPGYSPFVKYPNVTSSLRAISPRIRKGQKQSSPSWLDTVS